MLEARRYDADYNGVAYPTGQPDARNLGRLLGHHIGSHTVAGINSFRYRVSPRARSVIDLRYIRKRRTMLRTRTDWRRLSTA